jgi:hypothetical protein
VVGSCERQWPCCAECGWCRGQFPKSLPFERVEEFVYAEPVYDLRRASLAAHAMRLSIEEIVLLVACGGCD